MTRAWIPRSRARVTTREQIHRADKRELVVRIGDLTQGAFYAGAAEGTKKTSESHLRYWHEFCEIVGLNATTFGTTPVTNAGPSIRQLNVEMELFSAFATYIVYFPRIHRRDALGNSVDYAEQVISSVRTHYGDINGRRPGLRDGGIGGGHLKRVLKGLRKLRPRSRKVKLPILQHHLRAMRRTLDLERSQMDRVLWALWLTQWQGVMRTSDLIRGKSDQGRRWDPSKDTHLGRLKVDLGKDTAGRVIGARLGISLKPNKTDQDGSRGTVKTFIIDQDASALSAGEAIRKMLEQSDREGLLSPDQTPLFRNPETRKEITYGQSHAALSRSLRRAGFPQLATGTHSLRIGGATAYANSPQGGEMYAGFMGLWKSDAFHEYLHACALRLEAVGISVGREKGMDLAIRPGPVSRFAARQRR